MADGGGGGVWGPCRGHSVPRQVRAPLGSAGTPDCGGRPGERETGEKEEGRGGGRPPESPPRPRHDPQAETQQGPYATAPPRGWGRGRAAQGGRPEQRYLREGRRAASAALRARAGPPAAQTGRASSAAAAPFLLLSGGPASPGSREAARWQRGKLAKGRGCRREASGRTGAGRRQGRAGQRGPGGGRWQEGGDWRRGAGRRRAGFVVVVNQLPGPFNRADAGRKCVTRGPPDARPAGPCRPPPRRGSPGPPWERCRSPRAARPPGARRAAPLDCSRPLAALGPPH